MITLQRCRTQRELRLFEQIPEMVHEADPCFVPPIPGSVVKLIEPGGIFLRQPENQLIPLIAYRGSQPVGRIAAIVNQVHNDHHKDRIGFFGFFDFINDEEVAKRLFSEAKRLLQHHGVEAIRGPYSPTIHHECGLLVEGFDHLPHYLTVYNPRYYVSIYDHLCLQKKRNLYAYFVKSESLHLEPRIQKLAQRFERKTTVRFRLLNRSKIREEVRFLYQLISETWDVRWGYIPLDVEELMASANDLKHLLDPNMVFFAENENKPIGCIIFVPNINEFLVKTKTSHPLIRQLKLLWMMKTKHTQHVRLIVLGILKEYRNLGIGPFFYQKAYDYIKNNHNIESCEFSWIDEGNEEVLRLSESFAAQRYKTYEIREQVLI